MNLEIGAIVEGKVSGITNFGAFIDLPDNKTGMVHISEVSNEFVKDINDYLKKDQIVKAKVIRISDKGEIALSIKKTAEKEPRGKFVPKRPRQNSFDNRPFQKASKPATFEDMLSMFKHASEEKMSDLKKYTESKRGSSRKGTQR